MDPTTDPALRSFVECRERSHFPIQNLPYGIFSPMDGTSPRPGIRIGDYVLDLRGLEESGLLQSCGNLARKTFDAPSLNRFLALGRPAWREVRAVVSDLLRFDNPRLRDDESLRDKLLFPVSSVEMQMPVEIGDYTDFYSSKVHATNVGTMFRGKDNALMPNYLHLPVGYHGRASSVILHGTDIVRPCGQTKADDADAPSFGPSRLMDFELEMGFFTGPGNNLGETIALKGAEESIFGLVLVNDWSARDIQKWEYQPLGPFNAKNFATSISSWIVTLDALEPFRCAGPEQDPVPLDYLKDPEDWAYDIHLDVYLGTEGDLPGKKICASNFRHMYWNIRQQLAHHTVTGCNVRPGDLMGSGTISAPDENGYGSMLELTWKGTKPIRMNDGSERKFLQDGDTVTITGYCKGDGYCVGFGEVAGKVLPAKR